MIDCQLSFMKSLIPIFTTAATAVMVCTAVGEELPAELQFLPPGGMRLTGESVTPAPTPEFLTMQKEISARLQSLSTEQKLDFFKTYRADTLMPYNPVIWPDKAAYERYTEEWKKIGIKSQQTVQVGAHERGNGQWGLHGISVNTFTRAVSTLSLSNLVYDAGRNVWISANGELAPVTYTTGSDNVYGATKGTRWSLKKSDSLSIINETLSISKRTNGEFVYLAYAFSERTPGNGTVLAQGSYVLRFRVGPPAPDPAEEVKAPEPEKATTTQGPQAKKETKNNRKSKNKKRSRRSKRKNR